MKSLKYYETYENVTPRHEVSKQLKKMAPTDLLDTGLPHKPSICKNAVSAKRNKASAMKTGGAVQLALCTHRFCICKLLREGNSRKLKKQNLNLQFNTNYLYSIYFV